MNITRIKLVPIIAFAFSSLLMGCSEEVYDGAYKPSLESLYLSVYPRDFEFGNGEETKTGYITSENTWSFSSVPSWLSISPTSGNSNAEFSATSAMNETMANRTSLFYISANTSDWKQQKAITVSQASALPSFRFLNLENTSIYLEGTAQTCTIDVETNLDDLATKVMFDFGSDNWITASYANKRLTISISANDDGYERSGRVELWSSAYSKGGTIYITQYKPNLSFNEITSLSFDADGGSQTVKVSSDLSWSALSKESWIEISPSQGAAGDNSVKITVLPSYQSGNRNGKALFYYKDNQSAVGSISISQSGRYLTATPSSLTLSADENSSGSINIDSNIDWTIESHPDWISFNKNNGEAGKSTVTLSATKNNSLNSRSGTIIFRDSKSGGIESRVAVTQNGLDFGDQNILEFNWHQSTLPLNVPLPGTWNAAVSVGWISLSEYSGVGNKAIVVSASKNDGEETRNGKIIFTSEGKTIEVSVVQSGQYIKLDNTSGEFNATGGSLTLNVASSINTSWKVEYPNSDNDWISVNETSPNEFFINIAQNPSSSNRTATFVLYPIDDDVSNIYAQGAKLAIKQSGRVLSCETYKICLFAAGGTSETYKIVADGKYSIEKAPEDNWYTIVSDITSNTFYIVATDNTTNSDRSGQISLSLLDLPNGESSNLSIEVFQYKTGINISFDNFEEETVW